MRAGHLRYLVTIQSASVTAGADGDPSFDWDNPSTVASPWMAIEPLGGRELFSAQQVNADVSTRMVMRWQSGITPAMRVVYGSRVFDIALVRDIGGRTRELEILAVERV
jgi:SPP1 family predicted phage head-tail adaptor